MPPLESRGAVCVDARVLSGLSVPWGGPAALHFSAGPADICCISEWRS